ncbi:hypothetical protein BDC45DRAFT_563559 [Circinella umbellata]|nr:hypothetical protein BDC45DRAFT_563559 [Circinella umbellata]
MTFTFTSYIRNNAGSSFNIINCFRASKLTDQEAAEKEFKKAVTAASHWKRSAAQSWALKQILKNIELMSYWVEMNKKVAISKGKRKFYDFHGEETASSSNVREESPLAYLQGEDKVSNSTVSSQNTEHELEEEKDANILISDSESDDLSFNPDSQSRCSSETSKIHRKQKVAYNYLVGGGLEQYCHPSNCKKIDLVDEFLRYRSDVVKEAKEFELLSIVDRLALNFICYITPSSAIRNKMDPSVWDAMIKSVKSKRRVEDIDDKYILRMMKISLAARRNIDEAKKLVRRWIVEDNSEEAALYQDVLRDIFESYSEVYDSSKINEDTFVKDSLTPILKNYFPNNQLITTEGANGETIGSKERKKVFDSEAGGKRGDFTVSTTSFDGMQASTSGK